MDIIVWTILPSQLICKYNSSLFLPYLLLHESSLFVLFRKYYFLSYEEGVTKVCSCWSNSSDSCIFFWCLFSLKWFWVAVKKIWPLFMDRFQLFQSYRATMRRQFIFYQSVLRISFYSLNRIWNDERLSWPWNHVSMSSFSCNYGTLLLLV